MKHAPAPLEKLADLVQDVQIAMLTTVGEDGALYSRPMACQEMGEDGGLWFFTKHSSGKVRAILHDQHVNLTYAAPEKNRYVSVTGRAEVVDDAAKKRELWKPVYRAWFDGVDDPDMVLLKVVPESGEYWDGPSSKFVQLAGMVKAAMTGGESQIGENARFNLPH